MISEAALALYPEQLPILNIMDTEEDRSKTLDMIQRNLGQVAQMMNQLLDYSRLESGQEVLEISQFRRITNAHRTL
jgi:signal transduction histidine kinase